MPKIELPEEQIFN